MLLVKVKSVRRIKMKHYIKFELKNTFGYSIGMIVGGLLPLVLAIGGYHASNDAERNKVLSETIFSMCLPMIPLGLVMLPFTIAFAKDIGDGISTRFSLFGYTKLKQMFAKFISILFLVSGICIVYFLVLQIVLPLPVPSKAAVILMICGILILTISFYFLAFTIAWFFKGFNAVQGIARVAYFGIAIITGTIGGFDFTGVMKKISDFVPFNSFRTELANNWTTTSFDMSNVLIRLIFFMIFTVLLFCIANIHLIPKKILRKS